MAEERHGLHEEPRPNAPRRVSAVEREREWLAKQYSKEREAYRRPTRCVRRNPTPSRPLSRRLLDPQSALLLGRVLRGGCGRHRCTTLAHP